MAGENVESISMYFTREELEKMPEYEKTRLINMKKNYVTLTGVGKLIDV